MEDFASHTFTLDCPRDIYPAVIYFAGPRLVEKKPFVGLELRVLGLGNFSPLKLEELKEVFARENLRGTTKAFNLSIEMKF